MSDINRSVTSTTIFKAKAQLVLSVALAYAFMGWIGLALAIPPGYASPVFPAAGLALGCVLWFGPTVLAGVWLGSALLNLSHPWWAGTLTPSTAVVAIVIATGATLQAWVGSGLVRHRQDPAWRTLEREQDVFVFLLLGGVVAGVVSALVGVTGLQAFGVIEGADFLFTMWNWYVGDLLGVLVFAPLTLCLLNREGELWRDRRRRIVIPMLLTLGLVALAFYGAARWGREAQQSQLEADSEIVFERIRDRVIAHREVLSSLKRFIEATPDFSFKQFELFTRITLQDNPDIFALSFNDLIADEKRPAFESMMSRLSPLGPFQITERNTAGKLIRAMTRPEYVTVRYIVPLANNQPAVGYDIYSEPVRRDAINRARASGVMAVTAPIRLVQEQRQRVGLLELLPVTSAPANEQVERLVGFAVAVVKVDEMIDIATRGHVPAGLFFQLIDPHAPDGQGPLYSSGSPAAGNIAPARAAHWKTTLRMGDRDWGLTVHTTREYEREHRSWMAWAVGVAGLLFAALLQILMLGMTGRTSIIQRENEAITKRVRAEEALRESMAKYRSLIEQAGDGIFLHDKTGRILDVNRKACESLGYTREELLARTIKDIDPEAIEAGRSDLWSQVSEGKQFSFESHHKRKDGSAIPIEITLGSVDLSVGQVILAISRDITERKQAEAALRDSEERYRSLVETTSDWIWEVDAETRYVYASDKVRDLLGYAPEEVIGRTPFDLMPGPEARRVESQFKEIAARRLPFADLENTCFHKNGSLVVLETSGVPLFGPNGEFRGYRGMDRNITERKQAEAALRDSEERFRLAMEASRDGLWDWNVTTDEVYYSPGYAAMLGYTPGEVPGHVNSWKDLIHPEDKAAALEANVDCIENRRDDFEVEFRMEARNGEWRWILARGKAVARDRVGRAVRLIGTHTDITERKRAEEALLALSVRQQALLAAIPDIVMEVDHRRIYTWANQAGLDFFGADVLGQEASVYFEGVQDTYDKVEPLFQGGEDVIYVESWQRRRDGQKRLLAWWCRVLKDEQGRVTGALSSARDITEAKQAEAALRDNEEKYRGLVETTDTGYVIVDDQGRVLDANQEYARLTGRTRPEEVIGHSVLDWTAPYDHARNAAEVSRCAKQGFVRNLEVDYVTPSGQINPIEINATVLRVSGRLQILSLCRDISQRKMAQDALRASLEEKTALLQEVHHRVKNNLQIVSSLLNLQAGQEKSQPVLAALRDTQNRVRSMAVLHEMLYRSESLARVNFAAYIEGLCAHLFRAFGADPNRVRLDCHTTAVEVGLDQAVPCGLIINELVSNALEHAFPEGRAGRITVKLRREADDRLALTVADDGVGLPAGLDFSQTSTLGLQLVRLLTTQLKGTLGMERAQGAAFQVTFPSH